MMLFGEGAGAAWVTAGERMRRWAGAFDDWRQERRETHHKTAACNDKLAWGEFLGLVKKAPWEVDWRDVQVYVDHSLEEGMTPGTLTNRLTSLSKFYDFVQEKGMGSPTDAGDDGGFNPVKEIERPNVQYRKRMRYLSAEKARALMDAIDREWSLIGKRDYAMFLMHLVTGLQSGEIRHLRRDDLRAGEEGSEVRQQIGGEDHWATLPSAAWAAIQEYLQAAGRWAEIQAEEYIFAPIKNALLEEPSGKAEEWASERPISVNQCHSLLKKYASWAGLEAEKVTMHTLRHTAAMLQVEAGVDAAGLQAFLGNKSLDATKSYLRILAENAPQPAQNGEGPTRDLSVPPQRGPSRAKPGEQRRLVHGFYTENLPDEEVQAVIAEGIIGMEEEIKGLRTLSRALRKKQSQVKAKKEVVQLGGAYMLAVDRLRVMITAEGNLEEFCEQDEYNEAVLTMLDNAAVAMGGEPILENVRQLVAASDPEMLVGARRLTEEIANARLVLRNLFPLAMEAETVKERVLYTELYGRGCIQLARMLKFEGAMQDQLGDFLRKEMDAAILEVNAEWGLDLGG